MLIQFLAFPPSKCGKKGREKIVKRIFILRNRKRLGKKEKENLFHGIIYRNRLSFTGKQTSEVKLNQATTCVKLKINQKIFSAKVRDVV